MIPDPTDTLAVEARARAIRTAWTLTLVGRTLGRLRRGASRAD